jgi:regulatory protein
MENDEKLEQEIYGKLARLCSKSEQCSPDLLKKIKESGGSSLMAEKIIDKLEKENFLNDERFVKSYAREKFRVYKWGRVKMHYYLKQKGLKEETIDMGLNEIENAEYVQLLVRTMREKAKTIKVTNKFEKMGQIIRFAQGRGFEPELIHRYINEVIS